MAHDDWRLRIELVEEAAGGLLKRLGLLSSEAHDLEHELAARLEQEGYGVVRRFNFVIAGTATRAEAHELAERLDGEAGPGGELVWEVSPGNPFAVFGGLGGSGTPI